MAKTERVVSTNRCRIIPFLDQERRRCAPPLARRQRRALPWKARPAHAGPHRHRCADQADQSIAQAAARGCRINDAPWSLLTRTIDPEATGQVLAASRRTSPIDASGLRRGRKPARRQQHLGDDLQESGPGTGGWRHTSAHDRQGFVADNQARRG